MDSGRNRLDWKKMNKHASGRNLRKEPRIDVQIWIKETCENAVYYHLITNLSKGGFFIDKRLPFPIGSSIEVELDLSAFDSGLCVKGIVVDNYRDPASNTLGAGVKFIEMDEDVTAKIEAYLQTTEDFKAPESEKQAT